jgi:hypothetical protein
MTVPDGFAVATPGDWLVFDLDALVDPLEVGAFLDARQEELPELATHRDDLHAMLIRAGEQAKASDVMFAAALATVREDGAPVAASLSVASLDRRLNEEVLTEAAKTLPRRGVEDERATGRVLPAGYAARLESVNAVPLTANAELVTLTVQYLLEVPGSDEAVLALTFVTPAMAHREQLCELFEHVAATFEWTYEED